MNWISYSDGASRGNPGPASSGVHLISPTGEEYHFKEYLGQLTNNQAEYSALILALTELVRLKAEQVTVRADSELMIKQMRGEYKVKNEKMLPLFNQAKTLAKNFKSITYTHIPREQNKVADDLANQAIDEALA